MAQRNWFQDFCEKTTLNCMQYFVMKKRSPIEKFVFYIIIINNILCSPDREKTECKVSGGAPNCSVYSGCIQL